MGLKRAGAELDPGRLLAALDSLGRLPAGVGEQLSDNLPVPIDTRQQEVVDEGDRPPVASRRGLKLFSFPSSLP